MRIGFSPFTTSIVGALFALLASGCFQRGTESRFYLMHEPPAPLYAKGGLYDPVNVQAWAQIIRARRFFERELAPALAQHREALSHDEFLVHLTTRENEDLFALDVRIQLGSPSREQNVTAALREALDQFYAEQMTGSYRGALETRSTLYTESERATLRQMSRRPHRLVIHTEVLSR